MFRRQTRRPVVTWRPVAPQTGLNGQVELFRPWRTSFPPPVMVNSALINIRARDNIVFIYVIFLQLARVVNEKNRINVNLGKNLG